MMTMDLMWWLVVMGVALPLGLAFLVGHGVETYRSRILRVKVANERRDIEDRIQELEAQWDALEVGWRQLEAEKADGRGGRPGDRR